MNIGTLLLIITFSIGLSGTSWAVPIYNDGSVVQIQYNKKGNVYGDYVNSDDLLFIATGNNDGNNLPTVEALIENALALTSDFLLTSTSNVTFTSYDGGYTGEWEVVAPIDSIRLYAIKAANAYAMYYVEPSDGTGSWSTYDLAMAGYGGRDGVQISHYTGYNV